MERYSRIREFSTVTLPIGELGAREPDGCLSAVNLNYPIFDMKDDDSSTMMEELASFALVLRNVVLLCRRSVLALCPAQTQRKHGYAGSL
jgi:hypothetical protein